MDQISFLQKKLVKWEKILEKCPYQNIYDINSVDGRLSGGADSRVNNEFQEENFNPVNPDQLYITIMESDRNFEFNQNNPQQIPEDKEIDETLNNAIHNIQEVSNSVIDLTKTHEHELKILFAAILAKLQRYSGVIQERLSNTKNALNSLQLKFAIKFIELQTKNQELIQIRSELAKCREENERQLPVEISAASTQTLQTISGSIAHASKDTVVHPSPSQKTTICATSSYQVKGKESLPTQTATSHSVIVTNQNSTHQVLLQSVTNPSAISNNNAVENVTHNISSQVLSGINSTEIPEVSITTENSNLRVPVTLSTSNNLVTKIQDHNTVVRSNQSPVFLEKPSSYRPSTSHMENSELIIPRVEPVSSSSVHQPSQQQREIQKDEREVQLLAKIEEICRENEQLKKEKLEYEQTVQKALYRGISSLNSEAIKLLPNLPLICYQPCHRPCSYLSCSASSILSEMIDGNKYVQVKSNVSSKKKIQLKNQARYYRPPKACSQCHMTFMLTQKKLDNSHINIPQFCVNDNNYETRKTVCHGGSCDKEALKVHKQFDAVISDELCKGNFQGYTEAISYSNIVKSSGINKSQRLRHCTRLTKSKRIY